MMYRVAPEVEKVMEDVLFEYAEHYEELSVGPRIQCVMLDKTPEQGGHEILGRVKKVMGLHGWLGSAELSQAFSDNGFFVLEIAFPKWGDLTGAQQKALVDSLLSQIQYDEETDNWRVVKPEFGEFPWIVERHGFWRPDDTLGRLATKMAEQLELLPEEDQERLALPIEDVEGDGSHQGAEVPVGAGVGS